MVKFVTFGETMAQYNASYVGSYDENGQYVLDCAGAESNVAVDLLRLRVPDVIAVWVSRLGDDEAGHFILNELRDRTHVNAPTYGGQHTGVSYLNHLPGDKHVKNYRRERSAASLLTFDEIRPHLENADVLHVTGITPALSHTSRQTTLESLRYARKCGIPVSFDLNYREQLWTPPEARAVVDEMIPYASLFKLGHDEAEAIWNKGYSAEQYASNLQRISGGVVVVTRGMDGAVACDGETLVEHLGYAIDALDPVGAGDAFVAGFLGSIFERNGLREFLHLDRAERKLEIQKALEVGNVCGALTCTRYGDTAAMPTMREVREFLDRQKALP